jgi:glycosyltransferase involved in cell wall biosynthesis
MSPALQILFVAPYAPSPIRVRPYQLLRHLVRRGHSVSLVCAASPKDANTLEQLRSLCARVVVVPLGAGDRAKAYLRALATELPLQAAHCLSPAFVEAVRAELGRARYDLVHIEHLRGAEVARAAAAALPAPPPLLLDAVDSISLLFERTARLSPSARARALALLDLARTRRYEAAYTRRFDHITITSPEDRWALETLRSQYAEQPATPISVVPNGVDLDYFAPGDGTDDAETVIFSGKMSYHANEAAALFLLQEIMPLIWRERPTARAVIAGAQPGPAIRRHGDHPQVTITGFVPDLRPYLRSAAVAVAPIRYGVGVQNKVLEAMAMALPTVAARQATVALGARHGEEVLVAESAAEFAAALLRLLSRPGERAALGGAGRKYVERAHSWEASAAHLEGCYEAARERAASRAKRIVSLHDPGFTTVLGRSDILPV